MQPSDEPALDHLERTTGLLVARPDGTLVFATDDVVTSLGTSLEEIEGAAWLCRLAELGEDPNLPERWRLYMSARRAWRDTVEIRTRAHDEAAHERVRLQIEAHAVTDCDTETQLCVAVVSRAPPIGALASESSLAMAREDARLIERRHIARELHANLQQLLYATKIHLSKLEGSESLSQAHDAGESIHELIDETIRVSRNLTRDLIPLSSTGLRSALDSLAEWMRDHHALRVDIEVDGDIESSSLTLRELAFECVREVLFNCVKHAHVDEALVRVDGSGEVLRFLVVDEGVGFDAGSDALMELRRDGSGGFGLSDIRARVERIGGKLDIESSKDSGTKVSILLPRSVAD